jgi:hypothetical protein
MTDLPQSDYARIALVFVAYSRKIGAVAGEGSISPVPG